MMNYMIVVLHAAAAFQYVPHDTIEFGFCTFICDYVCGMAMPTFFLISGYLFVHGFSYSKLPAKMTHRVRRLVVPYLVWNITFVLFYLGFAQVVPRLDARVTTYGLNTVAGAFSKVLSFTVAPIDAPLWFLRAIFFMSLFVSLIYPLLTVGRGRLVVFLSVAWCFAESCFGLKELLQHTMPAYALTCFIVGGVLARNGHNLVDAFCHKRWLILGMLALMVNSSVGVYSVMKNVRISDSLCMVMSVMKILEAPAIITIVSLLRTDLISKNPVYGYLKEMSFFAYAGHFLFCSILLHTLAPFFAGMGTGKFIVLICIFVGLGVPLMAVVYGLGRKLCPKALKLWDGTL